jgi:nucleoside-diphosphate-sugar epimerase
VLTHSPSVTIEGCRTISSDLYSIRAVVRQIRDCEGIVHMAATRSEQRRDAVAQDILGTGELLDLWDRGPFVYASSQAVYGEAEPPFEEFSPLLPATWYALGKYAGEFQLQQAAKRVQRPAIALRFAPVLTTVRGQLLESVYEDMRRGATFAFESNEGMQSFGISYTGPNDYATAVALALEIERSGSYNVASGYLSWEALLHMLAERSGQQPKIEVRYAGAPEPNVSVLPQRSARLDTARFVAATGFAPQDDWPHLVESFLDRKAAATRR